MKFPWNKKKRGQYRTAKQRIAEQKDLVDELMVKSWLADLREHPEYLRQVARQKFGLSDIGADEIGGYEPPSFVEQLKEVSGAKEAMDSIFGGGQQPQGWQGLMTMLPEIMQATPAFVAGIKDLMASGALQQVQQPQPEPQLPSQQKPQIETPEEPTQQQQITAFAKEITAMPAEEAASHLYAGKGEPGTIESFVFNSILGVSVDEILSMVPTLKGQYEYLIPFAKKLDTPKGKQWLALVLDEVNRLNSPKKPKIPPAEGENEGNEGEIP